MRIQQSGGLNKRHAALKPDLSIRQVNRLINLYKEKGKARTKFTIRLEAGPVSASIAREHTKS